MSAELGFSYRVEGIDETVAMLKAKPKAIVASGYVKALQAGSAPIVAELVSRAPVGSTTRWNDETFSEFEDTTGHGTLKTSVVVEIVLDSEFRGGYAKIGFGAQGHKALWLEYGHRLVVGKKKTGQKVIGFVKPHPFMRAAASATADRAIQVFQEELISTLKAAGEIDGA